MRFFLFELPWPFRHHRRHRHHIRVVLFIDGYGHELNPHRRNCFMTSVTAGHKVSYAIGFYDANGNTMIVTPTPDSPPVWTETSSASPSADTFAAAGDGLSAVLQTSAADAAWTDTVGVVVVVGGKTYNASDSVSVSVAPQELASIALIPTVS